MTGNNENPTTEIARIQDRYQITIPRNAREHLNIVPGDLIQFEIISDNGGINVHKIIPVKVTEIENANKKQHTPDIQDDGRDGRGGTQPN